MGRTLTKTEDRIMRTHKNNINMDLLEDSCHSMGTTEHSDYITKFGKPFNYSLSCAHGNCCVCVCVCVCVHAHVHTCGLCDDVAHIKVNPCVCHEDIQQEQRYGFIHS